ncbi:acyl-CoA N-acyltransferase [Aureobasidium namibiae CBS 147.97]|uniref:Acyl-CoA N-acyltransferase n=1 Tax=Aureobasidium namibiae CBS 147.97 TaxID=1043004 RepID=A0A074WPG0_9PEZI|nr:acyl-CoA N-acyltransferase [Aureobasidium namibiae CBS 147.97]KEQ75018.1 acyl-CoA N-acyltransferase [Aureobasidium namibiae CBS 147.97]
MSSTGATTIRLASSSDLPATSTLVSLAYSPYIPRLDGKFPAPMTADYASLINSSFLYSLIANETVIGCISLCASTSHDSALEINNLAIHPSSQGKGYGKLLLAFAEDVAKEKALENCCLYTNIKMVENVALYTKLGYKEIGRWSEDGFERVFFVKALN